MKFDSCYMSPKFKELGFNDARLVPVSREVCHVGITDKMELEILWTQLVSPVLVFIVMEIFHLGQILILSVFTFFLFE
jgi:hypothetical protein